MAESSSACSTRSGDSARGESGDVLSEFGGVVYTSPVCCGLAGASRSST